MENKLEQYTIGKRSKNMKIEFRERLGWVAYGKLTNKKISQ